MPKLEMRDVSLTSQPGESQRVTMLLRVHDEKAAREVVEAIPAAVAGRVFIGFKGMGEGGGYQVDITGQSKEYVLGFTGNKQSADTLRKALLGVQENTLELAIDALRAKGIFSLDVAERITKGVIDSMRLKKPSAPDNPSPPDDDSPSGNNGGSSAPSRNGHPRAPEGGSRWR